MTHLFRFSAAGWPVFLVALLAPLPGRPAGAATRPAADVLARRVTLRLEAQPVTAMLASIEAQLHIHFLYSQQLIQAERRVSVAAVDEPLSGVLHDVLAPLRIEYAVVSSGILLAPAAPIVLTGRVLDEQGRPMPGATVLEQNTSNGTGTDADGRFTLKVLPGATLVISAVGYRTQTLPVAERTTFEGAPGSERHRPYRRGGGGLARAAAHQRGAAHAGGRAQCQGVASHRAGRPEPAGAVQLALVHLGQDGRERRGQLRRPGLAARPLARPGAGAGGWQAPPPVFGPQPERDRGRGHGSHGFERHSVARH
ncbi:MAG: carboxypeptidase-like regulatory domain-containing protein [Hymenobacter sp.]